MIEYPKMLYKVEPPHNLLVQSKEEEVKAIKEGWQLAETFFSDAPKITEDKGSKDKGDAEKGHKKGK